MKRSAIVAAARSLVGVPYVHAGRSAKFGVDCVGVITCVADALGYKYQDMINYPSWPDGKLIKRLEPFGVRVEKGDERPGDVPILWLNRKSKVPQHVGIFTDLPGRLGLVHAINGLGKVVETGFDVPWQKRLMWVLRFKGVED